MDTIANAVLKVLGMSLVRYFVLAGIPFALFYLLLPAKFRRFKIQGRLASKKDFIREISHSMVSVSIFTLYAIAILFTPLRKYTLVYDQVSDYPAYYIWISLALSLIIHDTYFYWMHRLLHHKRLFAIVHLVHHKSNNPSPWASYSFHLLEAFTEGFILLLLVFVLPMHPITILLFTVTGFIINVYGHLGYEIAPKWFRYSWLFEILNTSVHHNLHHSQFKGNYGLYFRIWDRLMGTEHPNYVKEYDKLQEQRFGDRVKKQTV
jgi:sterol desaturase/sphingolipid hydroxylase (fatty acid hydroxylase superfamily)